MKRNAGITAGERRSLPGGLTGIAAVVLLLSLTARAQVGDGLFGYWPLEETDPADLAADLGPNGMDGVLLPGVDPDVEGAPDFGSGAAFDGTVDGSIDLGRDSPLGTLLSDFTIVAWIFPTDLTGKNRIIGSLQPNGWGFGPVNADTLEFTTFGVLDYRVSVAIPQDEWTHVAVVLDENADATFYVNGEFIGTVPAGGPARLSFDNFYLGRAASSAEYFTGRLDEIAVFEGSLTDDDIIEIMEDGIDPGVPPCSVRRALSPDRYDDTGVTVEATLTARNIAGATTITDTFPDGWTVTAAGGGTVQGSTISFSVTADGNSVYSVSPPAGFCADVTFSGTYSGPGDCEGDVGGTSELVCTLPELFGYWPLEETDPGDLAADLGPNGMDGVLLPGVDPDVEGAPDFGFGAAFDGTVDGSIDLGIDSPLGTLLSDFTIVAWIFPTDLTGKNRIIGSLQPNGWGFGPVNADTLEFTTFGVLDYRVSVAIPQDEWTHVAVVLDENADASFYVNGEFIGTVPAGGPARPSFDNFYIGRAASSAEYFTGRLDEVAVFEGALTEDDIIEIMEDGVLPSDVPTPTEFRRGDVNADDRVNVSDGVAILSFLFTDDNAPPPCLDAGDIDDNGSLLISDPVALFNHLFSSGDEPPAPGPNICGVDPTDDPLTCDAHPACE